ncbi:unnamed protein product [Chrysodeixis includens]|uniref:RNA cytidine acetyltransferase n=1 Tax=Chrysodeixis includens TaxID=689277 RepID=A0A9N8PZX9_CHRIL|nr:unnamed protein product [Chrysodeixis includens]
MVKKKIDNRIRVMIENGVKLGHRTMFLLVGDKSRDQVPILYDMLVKSTVKARPTVLWCYKNKDEAISNHGRKRAKKIAAGKLEVSEESLFDSFRVATTIHGRYYSESHTMLGQTYGMCVLQTVEGGGLIVFLLKSMDSLRQLHSITMDVHSRFKTEAYDTVVNRFNERFLLSLADNPRCLVLDDSLTVLPISSKTAQVEPVDNTAERVNPKLTDLISSLSDSPPAGPLVALCRTYDQATALVALINTLADKQSRPPHCLTAARGRGKSACLGLSIAAAVALGYVNIYVTSPHPENLITLFEFLLKGLDACLYQEHIDYNIVRSTNPDFKKAIVRVNIARNSRQTVQYITPDDHSLLAAADLVLVDEAAAIPLPHVSAAAKRAPLALLSSTVSGYEGTGRALSLKLFAQLQTQHDAPPPIKLEEPIRYRSGDPIEAWLNSLLCLDAPPPSVGVGAPPPASCELYRVNRDALFCYHKAAEAFLHRLVAIYVASHYKNSPNDIQLLADAPAHCLFVLLAPTPANSTAMPEILCVIQLCLEGNISDKIYLNTLLTLSICLKQMGYGKRALQQLAAYYAGDIPCLDEDHSDDDDANANGNGTLQTESIVPRAKPPTLLKRLTEVRAEHLDYLGTSFGLTEELLKFWKSQKYVPVYLSQKTNELTGEHSCIMLRSLRGGSWLPAYSADFRKRLSRLLARALRGLPASLALSTLVNDNVSVDKPGKIYTCKYGYIRNIPASCYVLSAARGSRPIARTSGRDCRVSWRERYEACLPHWLCPHWSTIMSALTSLEHSCIMLRSLRGSWLPAYSADFRKRLSRLLARALRGLPASLALSTLVNDNVSVDKPGKIYTCKYGYIRNIPASCYVLSAARGSRPIARTSGRDCRVSWRERYEACLPHWLCPHWSTIMSALTSLVRYTLVNMDI